MRSPQKWPSAGLRAEAERTGLSGGGLSAPTAYVGYSGSGVFIQSGGTVALSSLVLAQSPAASGTYNLNGGLLALSTSGLTSGPGAAAFNFSGGTFQAGSSFSTSVPIVLGTAGGNAVFDSQANALTLAGPLSGPGGLQKIGAGSLTLSVSNTYTGTTLVSNGTLLLADSNAVSGSTVDTSGGGSLSFGTLSGATFGGLQGSGNLALGVALSVGNNNASTTFSGGLSGSGSLTKIGSGALALTGSNTYTGPTTINQGALAVNGLLVSPVTVNSGGVLSGTGSLSSVTVNSGGQLAPGDAPGVMSLSGNLSLLSGAEMDYALDTPATSDEVLMPTGQLVLAGQQFSDFNFTPLAGFGRGTYTLIEAAGIYGSLGPSTSGTIDGYAASLAVQGNNELVLIVPEPSTLALLIAAAGGLAAYRRRRKIQST